jgi:hypothetical protein
MTFGEIAAWTLFAVVFGSMFFSIGRGLITHVQRLREMYEHDEQRDFVRSMVRGKIFMLVMLIVGCILTAKALLDS